MTTSQSNTYNFIYDTTAGIPAVLMEQEDSETPKLYIRTPDGRLIARVTATATPTLDFYYHFDGLGSTRALTDSGGNTTDIYKYDVWGNVTYHAGTTSQPYQFVGQLGYYTHYQDPKLQYGQMLQLGVRYYVPSLGRFTQRDRISDYPEISTYAYSDLRPTVMVDVDGFLAREVNPQMYNSCASANWDAKTHYKVGNWQCTRRSLNKKAFLGCLVDAGIDGGASLLYAAAYCVASGAWKAGPQAFGICMANQTCSPGNEGFFLDVYSCVKDNMQDKVEKPKEVWACSFKSKPMLEYVKEAPWDDPACKQVK